MVMPCHVDDVQILSRFIDHDEYERCIEIVARPMAACRTGCEVKRYMLRDDNRSLLSLLDQLVQAYLHDFRRVRHFVETSGRLALLPWDLMEIVSGSWFPWVKIMSSSARSG